VTPRPTKIALVATLALTAAAFAALVRGQRAATLAAADVAPILWLLTALFAVRVSGQVVVALRRPRWLPPMEDWNLVPYRLLLPQLGILGVMTWIDVSFVLVRPPVERAEVLGWALVGFSALYAGAMATRYIVRMRRGPRRAGSAALFPSCSISFSRLPLCARGFHVGS
jgi:hypothetical protein